MKKIILFVCTIVLISQFVYAQKNDKLIIKSKEDVKKHELYGKYAADGYYFQITESNDEHLFLIKYEMLMYNQETDQKEVVESCDGYVDYRKGKLFLTWKPCIQKFNDVKIIPDKEIEFKFLKKYYPGDGRAKKGKIVHLNFNGGPEPHRVD